MDQYVKADRRVMWGLAITTLLVAVAVAFFNPGLLSFRAFSVAEFVQMMLPLVMVSLFIESVLEVFLTSWRAHRTPQLEQRAQHQSQTRRIAFFAGTTLGVIVAALGIRVLELFIDPTVFQSLSQIQQRLFRTTDVLLTGAVLGGGSDALHQLVLVFTNFMGTAARRAKGSGVGQNPIDTM